MLYEKNLQNAEILKQENELRLKEKQLNNRNLIAILSVLLGLLISGFFIYTKWRYQKKTNSILAQKNKELLNSNQALERFAFASSHDLREPLNNINSFTGLILKDAIANNNTKHINYATVIKNSCDNLDGLIRGVLNYSQLKSSNTIVNVDLNQILDQVKSDLALVIKNKQVKIQSSKLPMIKSDKTKIYQVFKNIIENGIKYNTSATPIINISFQEKDADWIFSFKDNGIGIEKKYHEVIFQMFKRLHNKEEYQGSGIGLASIKSFIDGLKGSIKVNSELDEGSEFVIRLPKI
jgi:light-regulated signal transduction histidine kinase (bacteriophytochrome)